MNTNIEQAPSLIFDWLESRSFEQLNAEQRRLVLAYFAEEEYTAMHLAAVGIKTVSHRPAKKEQSRKQQLMARFDQQHKQAKIIPLFASPVFAWQAASAVLLLLSGWLFYVTIGLKKDAGLQRLATTDTVFVNRETRSTPEIIHDTVYLYKQMKEAKTRLANTVAKYAEDVSAPAFIPDDIYVLPIEESENTAPRGNSMKDDSLPKRYGAVAL